MIAIKVGQVVYWTQKVIFKIFALIVMLNLIVSIVTTQHM